jgi:uncharacterized membrane protein HdeD (DUF308 family)
LVLFFSFGKTLPADEQGAKAISIDDPALFENKTFRLILGLATLAVGILKLFVVAGTLPVLSDFFPVIASLAGSFTLLLDYYTSRSSIETMLPDFIEEVFVKGAKYIGIVCIAVGVLHFVFPKALFL